MHAAPVAATAEVDEVFGLRLKLAPAAVAAGRAMRPRTTTPPPTALSRFNGALAQKTLADAGNLNGAFHLSLIVPWLQPVRFEILSRLHTMSQRYLQMRLMPVGRVRRATR